jgi:hypothetical protein
MVSAHELIVAASHTEVASSRLLQCPSGAAKPLWSSKVTTIGNAASPTLAGIAGDDDLSAGQVRRAITVRIDGADDIAVDVAECKGHLRTRASEFIDALLYAVSGKRTS